jgi:hypothetical protein
MRYFITLMVLCSLVQGRGKRPRAVFFVLVDYQSRDAATAMPLQPTDGNVAKTRLAHE